MKWIFHFIIEVPMATCEVGAANDSDSDSNSDESLFEEFVEDGGEREMVLSSWTQVSFS